MGTYRRRPIDTELLQHPPTPSAVLRRYRPGAMVALAGAPARALYLVSAGQVRVLIPTAPGREATTAVLGPGQVFGLAALLGQPTYHASIQAASPVEVWSVPGAKLLERLGEDPALLVLVLGALSRRLELARGLQRDIALLPVAARIADALARLEACLGGEPPRMSRAALAALVGARRETVCRARVQGEAPLGAGRSPAGDWGVPKLPNPLGRGAA